MAPPRRLPLPTRAVTAVAAVMVLVLLLPLAGRGDATTAEATEASTGYTSEIASGPLVGTSFLYTRSPNTPRVEDAGPIEGEVTYVGLACNDGEPVPEATEQHDIALLERGICTFVEKMGNVVAAGYSAVLMFNDQRAGTGCDAFPSVTTSAPIPLLVIWRTTGLQLLGEAGADPAPCPDGPETQAAVGTIGERVLISAAFDPASTDTGFEQRGGAEWTTLEEEHAFLEVIAHASERVEYSEIGRSVEDRPIHLVRIGDPAPPTVEEAAAGRTVFFVCLQHGDEQAAREGCLQTIRDLALTDDPEVVEHLGHTTVMLIPTASPDGQLHDQRNNRQGVNINRDHGALETPEGITIARALHAAQPDVIADVHECVVCVYGQQPPGFPQDFFPKWSRNLNIDDEVRGLAIEAVQEWMRPGVEAAGYTSALYRSPIGTDGHERSLNNMAGLRHSVGVLIETLRNPSPHRPEEQNNPHLVQLRRVDTHLLAADHLLRFHRANAEVIEQATAGSRTRKAQEGADQSRPYVLEGADNEPPVPEAVLDPPPCGYVLESLEAARLALNFELFGIETEPAGSGAFVPMAQPMQTVIPLLMDPDAPWNVVSGQRLVDCDEIPEPEPHSPPALHFTDFADALVGAPPPDWTVWWRDSNWTVADDPARLRHEIGAAGRRALTWDAAGTVVGDVEVYGRVRGTSSNTMFTLPLHVDGTAGNEIAYYTDARHSDGLRVNAYFNGSVSVLATTPFDVQDGAWYEVVLRRAGATLSAKIWPEGEAEPDWMLTVTDYALNSGAVGVGGFQGGSVNDWAAVGIGVGGMPAPREPLRCPQPDGRATVVIGEVDSGVTNVLLEDGCTINDLIEDDAEWRNRGAFMAHVTSVVDRLEADGVLGDEEHGRIVSAAARSRIGS